MKWRFIILLGMCVSFTTIVSASSEQGIPHAKGHDELKMLGKSEIHGRIFDDYSSGSTSPTDIDINAR